MIGYTIAQLDPVLEKQMPEQNGNSKKRKKKELLHACYTAECSATENDISSTNDTKFDKGYQGRYFIDKQAVVRIKINLFIV